jgi:integrase
MKTAKRNFKRQKTFDKSPVANLYRYVPTGVYYAMPRIGGKIKSKCLKTDKMSVAKMRLTDFMKEEQQKAQSLDNVARGKMTFGDAVRLFKARLANDKKLKPRSKQYRLERLTALFHSWPKLKTTDISRIRKNDCLDWAGKFGKLASPTAFNNTVGTLRMVLEIGVESGARYDNPANQIGKHRVRARTLQLPSKKEFVRLVSAIESVRFGSAKASANLVRFLAFGGFRKGEAAKVTWADCDFQKRCIRVKGDEITGTKNWSIRYVPMIDEMEQLLKNLRAERPDAKPTDVVMLVFSCQGALTRACHEIGVPRITHHDLRHLFATRCIESGVDIPTVSRWLGHKDGGALAMKVYGHLREEHSERMAKKVSFETQPEANAQSEKDSALAEDSSIRLQS